MGSAYSGLVVADGVVDVRTEFVLENGERQFSFAFSPTQIEMIVGAEG